MSRLYRALLLAYPRSFRYRFGRAMIEAFEDELAELRARGSGAAMARALWRAVRDALGTSFEMRWARWRGRPGAPLSRRETIGWWLGRGRGSSASGQASGGSGAPGPGPRRRALVDPALMDLKFAVRGLRRNPGFAVVAVLTLAIAIGASTAIFSFVDGLLLRPLPLFEPDRLVLLMEYRPRDDGSFQPFAISPANFLDWQERNRVFSGMSAIAWNENAALGVGDDAAQISGLRVSANFFDVLGVTAAVGRTFRAEEELPDALAVVVISHGLWERAFGGDPSVIGRTIPLSGAPHTVIGVAPADFSFTAVVGGNVDTATRDYWTLDPFLRRGPTERSYKVLAAVARLRPGVTIVQAREEMEAMAAALAGEFPEVNSNLNTGQAWSVNVENYRIGIVSSLRPVLWMLMGAVGFVLAIACTNVANLLLVRSASRRREVAVRAAIGAGRLRLARQMLTESFLLAVMGCAGGLLLAWWAIPVILPLAPPTTPPPLLENIGVDGRVLLFTAMIGLVTAIAFGLPPALRSTSQGPGRALRGIAVRGTRSRFLGRQLVVGAQIALALVLLVGVGLLLTTFARLYAIPLGFDPGNVYAVFTSAPPPGQGAAPDSASTAPQTVVRGVVERLEAHPEIESAAFTSLLPFWPTTGRSDLHVEGRPTGEAAPGAAAPTVNASNEPDRAMVRTTTPGYFDTLRIPLLRGRRLSWSDDASAPRVAVINEALAEMYFIGEDPIGRRVALIGRRERAGGSVQFIEIVGIVGNIWEHSHWGGLYAERPGWGRPESSPTLYVPSSQSSIGSFATFVARFTAEGDTVPATMREVIRNVAPQRRITQIMPFDDYVDGMLVSGELRLSAVIIGVLAGVSFLLALMGVYGTMAFHVTSRTHEIGIRMALGSRVGGIIGMIVGQGVRIAVFGALVGVFVAIATTHLLSRWLYQVSATDPFVFASLSIVMVALAVLACWIPAQRAARVDPITSLRAE